MKRTVIALAVLGIGIAGCGGGSSKLSRAKIVSKADAICAKAKKDAGNTAPSLQQLQDATVAAKYFDKIAPIVQKRTDDLAGLKPADDVKADYDAFISAQQASNALLQKIRQKADKKDPSGLQDLQTAGPTNQKLIDAANKLGAKTCA
jgi:hypothetical protein